MLAALAARWQGCPSWGLKVSRAQRADKPVSLWSSGMPGRLLAAGAAEGAHQIGLVLIMGLCKRSTWSHCWRQWSGRLHAGRVSRWGTKACDKQPWV